MVFAQSAIKLRAHAVQALEFIAAGATSTRDDARDRQRIMRRKLRKDALARIEHFLRADDIVEIGHRLAAEDRIIGEPALLRALDLRIPIGAFDEPDGEAPVVAARQIEDKIENGFRPLLIGLDGKPKSRPAGKVGFLTERLEHIEREFEPVGFFRVDRHRDIFCPRAGDELNEARHEFRHHPQARDGLEARMQAPRA